MTEEGIDEREKQPGIRSEWNTDRQTDYPVGPDDAGRDAWGGLVVSGWRWITSKFTNRP